MKRLFRKIINVYYFIINKINFYRNDMIVKTNIFNNIRGIIYAKNNGELIISEGVKINSRYSANPIGGQQFCTMIVEKNASLFIGENSAISNCTIVSRESIKIGKNVFIGGDCKIYDTDFHSINLYDRLKTVDKNIKSKPIVIEDGVFIGEGVTILKGVKINKEAVIGAGSVVTKDIPNSEIWAGNPAKFIRKIK